MLDDEFLVIMVAQAFHMNDVYPTIVMADIQLNYFSVGIGMVNPRTK